MAGHVRPSDSSADESMLPQDASSVMDASELAQQESLAGPAMKDIPRKRGYRACLGCRSRKLKCDLGDPSAPSLKTCRRCTRESRECVFDLSSDRKHSRRANLPRAPTLLPDGASAAGMSQSSRPSSPPASVATVTSAEGDHAYRNLVQDSIPASPLADREVGQRVDATDNGLLLSTAVHNPADALRLLASASSALLDRNVSMATSPAAGGLGLENWQPVKDGRVSVTEVQALLEFFERKMAPLYTLLLSQIFNPHHLHNLTSSESVLLGAIVSISARFCAGIDKSRRESIHYQCTEWTRLELAYVLDGTSPQRNIAAIEAFLLLAEWPPLPPASQAQAIDEEDVMKTSKRYDAISWSYIGSAVRLAQELGIDEKAQQRYNVPNSDFDPSDWGRERLLRTWLCALNADRHVSVRLGKAAVGRTHMPSAWWSRVLSGVSYTVKSNGVDDLWAEPAIPQACIAPLMGTIQDRLYPDKEVTRAIVKTGSWEPFLRNLSHELQFMKHSCRQVLAANDAQSTLLHIEFDYTLLYGNAIALRALQERLRDREKDSNTYLSHPTLLNLQEGPWLIQAVEAAAAILRRAVEVLQPQGLLSLCPCRIFQRLLFASVFLFKALAVGIVEHGQKGLRSLITQAIESLRLCSVDAQHIPRSFAALLGRLRLHEPNAPTKPPASSAPSVHPAPSSPPTPASFEDLLGGSLAQTSESVTDLPSVAPESFSGSTFFCSFPIPQNRRNNFPASVYPASTPVNRIVAPFGLSADMFGTGASSSSFGNADPPGFGSSATPWDWDPYVGSIEAVKEQENVFAGLWGTGDLTTTGTTLVDTLGLSVGSL